MNGLIKAAFTGLYFFIILENVLAYKCRQPTIPIVQKIDLPDLEVGKIAKLHIAFTSVKPVLDVIWEAYSPSLGYSFPVQENEAEGIAVLSTREKHRFQSTLIIKIKDANLKFSVTVFPQTGCHSVKYRIPIVKDPVVNKPLFRITHLPRDVQIIDSKGGRFSVELSVNVPDSNEKVSITKWYQYLNSKGLRTYAEKSNITRGIDSSRKNTRKNGHVVKTSKHVFDDITADKSGVYCADITAQGVSATVCTALEVLGIYSKLGLRTINVETCSGNKLENGVLLVSKDNWDCIKCSVSGFPTPLSFLFREQTPLAISRQSNFLRSLTEVTKTIWGSDKISGSYYCDGVISNILRKSMAFKVLH